MSSNHLERVDRVGSVFSRSGLTVLELLIVVSSITMLASLLFPAVHAARESTRNLQCMNNLRQIGLAVHEFHDSHQVLPAGWKCDPSKRTAYGWAASILNELDDPSLAQLVDPLCPVDELGSSIRKVTPAVFACPSDVSEPEFPVYAEIGKHDEHAQESTRVLVTLPRANYVGVFGTTDPDDVPGNSGSGVFVEQRGRRFEDCSRGLNHVVLVGERTARKLPSTWLGFVGAGEDAEGRIVGFAGEGPNRDDADECEFDSRHLEHVNFLWADGHVAGVQNNIDRQLYQYQAKYR
ncbi:MAG: DUF1559 domain-containing protein [Pirellulales bacterium]|jgi:prepilin-type processing-associated H-X9-DG protein|nr:DUF1559 domain-containing protein [Pirellulales bacterium]